MYKLEISPKAFEFISEKGKDKFKNRYAIIIADTTCCGGILSVELMDLEKAKRDMNLTLVFQKGIRDLSCGVWIEQQAITDDVIPEKILIDLNPFSKVKKLELKNADFEQPY